VAAERFASLQGNEAPVTSGMGGHDRRQPLVPAGTDGRHERAASVPAGTDGDDGNRSTVPGGTDGRHESAAASVPSGTDGHDGNRSTIPSGRHAHDQVGSIPAVPAADTGSRRSRHIPAHIQRAVLRRAGYRCEVPGCGNTLGLETDHLILWSEGGTHSEGNLLARCHLCCARHKLHYADSQIMPTALRWARS